MAQWASATLPSIGRDLDAAKTPKIAEDHRKLVLNTVSSIDTHILLMIKDRIKNPIAACAAAMAPDNQLKFNELLDQIVQWHAQNQAEHPDITALAAEIKSLAN